MNYNTDYAILNCARAYANAFISMIPVVGDATQPLEIRGLPLNATGPLEQSYRSWNDFRRRIATDDELYRWFGPPSAGLPFGIGVIGGPVSAGLAVLDFHEAETFSRWWQTLPRRFHWLANQLVIIRTPLRTHQIYFRSQAPPYVAWTPIAWSREFNEQTGKQEPKLLVDVKREGEVMIGPPLPAVYQSRGCHHEFVNNALDLTSVPIIDIEAERQLTDHARFFGDYNAQCDPYLIAHALRSFRRDRRDSANFTCRPAVHPALSFEARTTWRQILEPSGWTLNFVDSAGTEYWRRPGMTSGMSATANYGGCDLLHVFWEAAPPLIAPQTYDKFSAYAILNHDGDFETAARLLAGSERVAAALGRARKYAKSLT